MKRLLLILTMVLVSFYASAQVRVPGTSVFFVFPNEGWKYLQTTKVDKNVSVYLYSFDRRVVVDAEGDTVLPYLSVYVKKNCTESVYDVVYQRYESRPYQSLNESVENVPGGDGIFYVGAYRSAYDNKEYEFRMLYMKVKNTLIEFRLETTQDTFEEFDEEFLVILNSIKIEK